MKATLCCAYEYYNNKHKVAVCVGNQTVRYNMSRHIHIVPIAFTSAQIS